MAKQKPNPRNNGAAIGIPNEQHDDITQYFQKLKPPPPPDNDNSWELQYCRWWGWNWVKKKKVEYRTQDHVHQSKTEYTRNIDRPEPNHYYRNERDKKVRKKHFQQLCNCLCFKKKKSSLQDLYKTPSNSVVLHETYTCGYTEREGDSISHLEMTRNVSRSGKKRVCKCNDQQVVSRCYNLEEEISSSCQEDGDDTPGLNRSTEESSEYINVQCCCKREKNVQSACEKNDIQTQTSVKPIDKPVEQIYKPINQNAEPNLVCACNVCQKTVKSKKKNKRLHIVCHCCCCCSCNDNPHNGVITGKDNQRKSYLENNQPPKMYEKYPTDPRIISYGMTEKVPLENNVNFLESMRPWDRIFYGTKNFSKFGTPSKKYPWVHGTKSDIMDKCYSLKIDEEFSSPVTGKTYNLSSVAIDNFEELTTSTLPDPIEVEEDIKYLNYLEDQIKMDFKSRVMLDTICDAILFKAKNSEAREKPSSILNEFTYPSEAHDEYERFLNDYPLPSENLPSQSSPIHQAQADAIAPETYAQMRHPRILQQVEDLVRHLLSNKDVRSSDLNRHPDERVNFPLQNEKDYDVNLNTTAESETIRNINKRVASPSLSEQSKRLKCELSSTNSLVKTVDTIIAKIDEIAVKGQVNMDKIQNVFNLESHDDKENCNDKNDNPGCSRRANTSEIFYKIDQIIKCSNDTNDRIEDVMQNACSKSFGENFNGTDAATIPEEKNEAEFSTSKESVDTRFNERQQNDVADTNFVNIKRQKCFKSMIPVRSKNSQQ